MTASLKGKTVQVIDRGSGIARGIADAARAAGAAAILVRTNTFTAGVTLHVDGGERLT